jgi:DNA-binding MarR family transcriptional regulator
MAKASGKAERDAIRAWVERVTAYYVNVYGMPPITARILGWLLICDPPEQSAAEIAKAIGASRASLTTNMRILIGSGLVHRLTRLGERTAYYRVDDDAWEQVIRRRFAGLAGFRTIAEEGLALVGAKSARGRRIRAAQAVMEWSAQLMGVRSPRELEKSLAGLAKKRSE